MKKTIKRPKFLYKFFKKFMTGYGLLEESMNYSVRSIPALDDLPKINNSAVAFCFS
jgi:hypothetical protein